MKYRYYILAAILFILIGCIPVLAFNNRKFVHLKIYNPTSITLNLELKCNWNKQEKRWMYWDIKTLYGNKDVEFKLPNKGYCQVWPKIR